MLKISLFDSDLFYDLTTDLCELKKAHKNKTENEGRNSFHDALPSENNRIHDHFRSFQWGARTERTIYQPLHSGCNRRNPPVGFPY